MAIILLLSQNFDFAALLMLLLYNLIFVAPLLVILFLAYGGMNLHAIKKWKMTYRAHMRLAIGVTLILLGWLLILIANGTINLN